MVLSDRFLKVCEMKCLRNMKLKGFMGIFFNGILEVNFKSCLYEKIVGATKQIKTFFSE